MTHLFSQFTLRDITFKNRIGVSPMCQYSAVDGMINTWHLVHLGSRACGGAGLVFTEATAVELRGRISPHDIGIWSDEHIDPLRPLVEFIESQGAVPGMQIAHSGRKGSTSVPWEDRKPLSDNEGGWEIVAPSPLPYDEGHRVPRELTKQDLADIQKAFREAAARAREAGFKILELHGAHGYLVHSFHSPLTNKRNDEYGGSFDNRIRFTLETVKEIRKEWPENLPFSVRLSCSDWVEGGWSIKDSIELANRLKWEGVDLIDCSSGGTVPGVKYPSGASWQVPFAEKIRHEAGISTAAVGIIIEPMQADGIIRNGRADIVLLGREMLRHAYWPHHAARILKKSSLLPYPKQYDYTVGSK